MLGAILALCALLVAIASATGHAPLWVAVVLLCVAALVDFGGWPKRPV